jgi:hypothetical protein
VIHWQKRPVMLVALVTVALALASFGAAIHWSAVRVLLG